MKKGIIQIAPEAGVHKCQLRAWTGRMREGDRTIYTIKLYLSNYSLIISTGRLSSSNTTFHFANV